MLPRQAPMSRRVKGLSDGLVGFDVTTLRRRYDGPDKVGKRSRAEREKIIISRAHRRGTIHAASSKIVSYSQPSLHTISTEK